MVNDDKNMVNSSVVTKILALIISFLLSKILQAVGDKEQRIMYYQSSNLKEKVFDE